MDKVLNYRQYKLGQAKFVLGFSERTQRFTFHLQLQLLGTLHKLLQGLGAVRNFGFRRDASESNLTKYKLRLALCARRNSGVWFHVFLDSVFRFPLAINSVGTCNLHVSSHVSIPFCVRTRTNERKEAK